MQLSFLTHSVFLNINCISSIKWGLLLALRIYFFPIKNLPNPKCPESTMPSQIPPASSNPLTCTQVALSLHDSGYSSPMWPSFVLLSVCEMICILSKPYLK